MGSPTPRSKITAPGTMGTTVGPTSMPQPCSSKYAIAPLAASKPKALPPLSMMAFTRSTRL